MESFRSNSLAPGHLPPAVIAFGQLIRTARIQPAVTLPVATTRTAGSFASTHLSRLGLEMGNVDGPFFLCINHVIWKGIV